MNVSIIVINYFSSDYVSKLIKSIIENIKNVTYEIIVADNSEDSTESEKLRSMKDINKLIINEKNLGFGAANNIAAKESNGDFLFFLNPDTIILNNAFDYFFDFYRSHPSNQIGAIGAYLLDGDMESNHSFGSFSDKRPAAFLKSELYKVYKKVRGQRKPTKPRNKKANAARMVDWVSGAAFLIRKDVFFAIDGFDSNIFLFSEEVDLQYRLKLSGLNSFVIPGPGIVHLHPRKRKMSEKTRVFYYESFLYFLKKYNSFGTYMLTSLSFLLISTVNIFLDLHYMEYGFASNVHVLRLVINSWHRKTDLIRLAKSDEQFSAKME